VRERLGYSLEKVGVAIGLDESSSRARISRYELGVHEPPYATAQLIAEALTCTARTTRWLSYFCGSMPWHRGTGGGSSRR
jgi:transcriptional regulator with XRE-family HTH domain